MRFSSAMSAGTANREEDSSAAEVRSRMSRYGTAALASAAVPGASTTVTWGPFGRSKTTIVEPSLISSPRTIVSGQPMRRPFRNVPFLLPRSRRTNPSAARSMTACREDELGSASATSFVGPRPIERLSLSISTVQGSPF